MNGILKRLPPAPTGPAGNTGEPFWSDCKRRVDDGAITPILSNRVTASLFSVETAALARAWAEDIQCPLPDQDSADLARVAQFHSVHLEDPVEAKRQYLEALKNYLVASLVGAPGVDQDLVAEFGDESRRKAVSFSELAHQFGYPCYRDATCNPLRLLAELPLPIYLTTCYHQLLEHALAQTGHREPVSEIFYWHDGLRRIPSIFAKEPDYMPSKERPLVYHLFGRDDYPESLVLTEDDHLDYLVKLSSLSHEVKLADKALDLPACVSMALTGTALLLLDYRVYDWDFRVLFKGLVQATGESRSKCTPKSIVVQLATDTADKPAKLNQIKAYLSQYFEQSHFSVYWGDMMSCIETVWQRWKNG